METINSIILVCLFLYVAINIIAFKNQKNEFIDLINSVKFQDKTIQEIHNKFSSLQEKINSQKIYLATEIDDVRSSIDTMDKNNKTLFKKVTDNQTTLSQNQDLLNENAFRLDIKLELIEDLKIKMANLTKRFAPMLGVQTSAYEELKQKYDILMGQKSHIHLQRQIDVLVQERNNLKEALEKKKSKENKVEKEIIENKEEPKKKVGRPKISKKVFVSEKSKKQSGRPKQPKF
jgi:chromosome segregation ATPase